MRTSVRVSTAILLVLGLAAFGGVRAPSSAAAHAACDGDACDDDGDRADDDADADDESDDTADDEEDDGADEAGDPAPARPRRARGACPTGMVRVGESTCMDRFEAPNHAGARPLVMQSARDAEAWCDARHKRLCTEDEWISACEGEDHHEYPYGDDYEDGRCNDDREWRTVNERTLAKWPDDEAKRHARELYQASPSGSKRGCKTRKGVADLTGNVEEWVTRTRAHANGYPQILIGCYWSGCYGGGKPTCHSTNGAHGPEFRFYETGFRCCKDPAVRGQRARDPNAPPSSTRSHR